MSNKTKTVAVIGTRGFPGVQGGVEGHSRQIYTRMRGINVRLYRRKAYLTPRSAQHFDGIQYVDLPSTRIQGFEAVWHTLLSVLHIMRHRPDVVHVHNIGPGMFVPLLRLMRLPVVLTYHSPNYEHSKWSRPARWLLRGCEWLSLRFSNRIIFVNKYQMLKYSEDVQRKSIYIPNGISTARVSTSTTFLDEHGIQPRNYLLAVGRLSPEKGFEYLVQAANALPEVKQVVIAGTNDHNNGYLDTLLRLDTGKKVIFTGYTTGENLSQLYSHARAYVLPSLNEGFPMVLLEAMSYGLPLTVSDIPGNRQVELPDANYFKPADVTALALAIRQTLSLPDQRIHYDLDKYDWQSIADLTQQQYDLA